jgi:hypothetical protein
MRPTCAFPRLACFADEDSEQIHCVSRTICNGVRVATNRVAECGEDLNEQRHAISFGMRFDPSHDVTSQTVECDIGKWLREV